MILSHRSTERALDFELWNSFFPLINKLSILLGNMFWDLIVSFNKAVHVH